MVLWPGACPASPILHYATGSGAVVRSVLIVVKAWIRQFNRSINTNWHMIIYSFWKQILCGSENTQVGGYSWIGWDSYVLMGRVATYVFLWLNGWNFTAEWASAILYDLVKNIDLQGTFLSIIIQPHGSQNTKLWCSTERWTRCLETIIVFKISC